MVNPNVRGQARHERTERSGRAQISSTGGRTLLRALTKAAQVSLLYLPVARARSLGEQSINILFANGHPVALTELDQKHSITLFLKGRKCDYAGKVVIVIRYFLLQGSMMNISHFCFLIRMNNARQEPWRKTREHGPAWMSHPS
jgi:hypothetical protein